MPTAKDDMVEPFASEIEAFERADRKGPPAQGAILFVGSSSFTRWLSVQQAFSPLPIINRGFGGSQLEDVLRYADRIIFPYKPRMVVVYGGDNDLAAGKTPGRVLDDYKLLVAMINQKLPRAHIAYVSIKPSPARLSILRDIRKANALIKAFCVKDNRLIFIDVFAEMRNPDGSIRDDLFGDDDLHLNRKGYALWQKTIEPYLD